MSQSQFKFERKSGGVSRKLKQAGNVSKIREFELEKVSILCRYLLNYLFDLIVGSVYIFLRLPVY